MSSDVPNFFKEPRSVKLKAYWSKKERDLVFEWPDGISTKSDASWLYTIFNERFLNELKSRGYDVRTIKFSVEGDASTGKFG